MLSEKQSEYTLERQTMLQSVIFAIILLPNAKNSAITKGIISKIFSRQRVFNFPSAPTVTDQSPIILSSGFPHVKRLKSVCISIIALKNASRSTRLKRHDSLKAFHHFDSAAFIPPSCLAKRKKNINKNASSSENQKELYSTARTDLITFGSIRTNHLFNFMGHTPVQILQFIHSSSLITGYSNPSLSATIDIAFFGQIIAQAAQPQQSDFLSNNIGVFFIFSLFKHTFYKTFCFFKDFYYKAVRSCLFFYIFR